MVVKVIKDVSPYVIYCILLILRAFHTPFLTDMNEFKLCTILVKCWKLYHVNGLIPESYHLYTILLKNHLLLPQICLTANFHLQIPLVQFFLWGHSYFLN